jgi:hypothetical protein
MIIWNIGCESMDQQVYERNRWIAWNLLSCHILECWYDSIGLVNIYQRYWDANMFFIFEWEWNEIFYRLVWDDKLRCGSNDIVINSWY